MSLMEPNSKLIRLRLKLEEFDYNIVYKKRKANTSESESESEGTVTIETIFRNKQRNIIRRPQYNEENMIRIFKEHMEILLNTKNQKFLQEH